MRCACHKKLREATELIRCAACPSEKLYCKRAPYCEDCNHQFTCGEEIGSCRLFKPGEQRYKCVDCDEFEFCKDCIYECQCGRGPQPHYVDHCDRNDCNDGECGAEGCGRKVCNTYGGFKHFSHYHSGGEYIIAYCIDHKPTFDKRMRDAVIEDMAKNADSEYLNEAIKKLKKE